MDIVTEAKISISISIENSRGLDVFLYEVFKVAPKFELFSKVQD
jgi:hypothetical protein